MNPQKRKVEQFLKLARRQVAYLPLGVLSVVLGAFVVGAIVNAASLTPPTAAYPEGQPQLDLGGGGGASNLLEVLRGSKPPAALVVGASYAKWEDWKGDTLIGGRLGLGQVRTTIATGTQRIGYPLDIQIVHKSSEDPTAAELATNAYLNKNNAAVLRIASGSTTANEKLYTGVRLDRLGMAPSATDEDTFSEKWFIGMDNATDNLVIRANGSNNIVSINPELSVKGAACLGSMFIGTSGSNNKSDGNMGGYIGANGKCNTKYIGSHLCSEEEIMRTIACDPTKLPRNGQAWINKGTPGATSKLTNDCKGWKDNSSDYFGGYWTFDGDGGVSGLTSCRLPVAALKKELACCK